MDEYTPSDDTTQDIRADFAGFPHRCNNCQHMEDAARFDRWLAAHDRAVAANAWEECKAQLWHEVRGLPYWRDPVTGHSEFDLESLGPDRTSQKSARVLIVGIFDDASNPYRITEENN